jgi:hypothetical protein
MYLVHLHLCRADGSPPTALPEPIGGAVRAAGQGRDGVEHVAVHRDAHPHPVLGVFVIADTLEDAEARARRAWQYAHARHPWLRPWALVQAAAPLIEPALEGLRDTGTGAGPSAHPDADVPGRDGRRPPGRNRPGPHPST